MKALKKFFAIIIAAVFTTILTVGCNATNNVSENEAETYLEHLYGMDFTLKSSETYEDKGDQSPNKTYTLTDENNIECHVCLRNEGRYIGSEYIVFEDYQLALMKNDPSIYEQYFTDDRIVTPVFGTDEACPGLLTLSFIVDISGYDDVEKAVDFAYDLLTELQPRFADKPHEPEIKKQKATVSFADDGKETSARYSTINLYMINTINKSEFLSKIQDQYVYGCRARGDLSDVPDAALERIPSQNIKNITYNGEVVLKAFPYNDYYNDYRIQEDCVTKEGCVFYPETIGTLLKSTGWEERISSNRIVWTLGDHTVALTATTDDPELSAQERIAFYRNGRKCLLKGISSLSEERVVINLTQSDLLTLFNIDIRLDQRAETGEIVLYT